MIAQTGWTAAQLRAQPARLVKALMWRAFARRFWQPELARLARTELPREAFSSLPEQFEATQKRDAAAKATGLIEGVLWPEGDDGDG